MQHRIIKIALAVSLLAFIVLPATAAAHSDEPGQEAHDQVEHTITTRPEDRAQLSDAKRKICEQHQSAITAIMSRGVARSQNQLTLFDTIATRTQAFYLQQGKSVENYDALVSAAARAKAQAEADLQTLTAASPFNCSGDPKGSAAAYKSALKAEARSLKTYRTTVQDLVAAVKSAKPAEGNDQ